MHCLMYFIWPMFATVFHFYSQMNDCSSHEQSIANVLFGESVFVFVTTGYNLSQEEFIGTVIRPFY